MTKKGLLIKVVEEYYSNTLGIHRTEWEMEEAAKLLRDVAKSCQREADHMRRRRKEHPSS